MEGRTRKLKRAALPGVFALMAAFLAGASPLTALGQGDDAGAPMTIYHEQFDAETLPPPGNMLTLSAVLVNSRDVQQEMRAHVSIDGRVMDVAVTKAFLNKDDFPEYHLDVAAPENELSYRFYLAASDGSTLSSARYSVRRDCSIDLTYTQAEVDDAIQGQERLNLLVRNAKTLKRENTAYIEIEKILLDLKKFVK